MPDPDILNEYRNGLCGYIPDPAADAALESHLRQSNQYAFAADAIDDYHLRDAGKDQVSLPFLAALELYPGSLPGGRQKRGSCVAWSTRNALMVSYCAYLKYGANTELFAHPGVSELASSNGAFSTETIYWFRRHGGDGWQCSAAAQVATGECGLMPRKNYPEIGIDLTEYSPNTEGRWGSSLPPQQVRDLCKQHISGNATVCKTWDDVRSMVASGYALSTCGMEAFEMKRDECGVAKRDYRDSWAHAMAVVAVDDRPEMRRRYSSDGKTGLVLVQNSWGSINTGPDAIAGTQKSIPPGAFWARWEDFKSRYCVALGPCKGWPAMQLPNWGTENIL